MDSDPFFPHEQWCDIAAFFLSPLLHDFLYCSLVPLLFCDQFGVAGNDTFGSQNVFYHIVEQA